MNKVINILLVSNMYPTKKHPVFGVFVKNTEILLNSYNLITKKKAVIFGRNNGLKKINSYLKLYLKTFFYSFNKTIDIIVVHFPLQISPLLLFLSYILQKKIVLNIHGSELNKTSIFHSFFIKLLNKSDLIIVPSNYYKTRLIEEYNVDSNKIYVYPSGGIDLEVFKQLDRNAQRKKMGIDVSSFVCAYISTISEAKGWRTFIEASEMLIQSQKNIQFLVVGNGPQEQEFKKQVSFKGLDQFYYFFDRQEQKKLVEFYNCSDVFIFPSHRESLGLVALESLACGIPVIAPNNEPFNEYVKDGDNGFLFNLKDANSLTEKIERFIKTNKDDSFSINSKKTAQKFEKKLVSAKLADRLKQLI